MSKHIFFLDNIIDAPHGGLMSYKRGRSTHHGTWSIDNLLGHFDDFCVTKFYNIKHYKLFNEEDKKYIFCFLHMPYLYDVNLSKESVEILKTDKNAFLILFSTLESVVTEEQLAKSLRRRNLPMNRVLVLSSNFRSHNRTYKEMRFKCINFWESYSRMHIKLLPGGAIISPKQRLDTIDTAKKKFISLNRNIKPHRMWWYYALFKTQMVKEGHVSYHLPMVDRIEYEKIILKEFTLNKLPDNLRNDFIETARNKLQVKKLDTLDEQNVINYKETIVPYYLDSLVSLITESESTNVFITEKTYKAMVNLHPFFIIGNPDQHVILKNQGYETFEDLFGVHSVSNYNEAIELINKLSAKDIEILKTQIKKDYFDKLLHNQQHFLNRKNSWLTIENEIIKTLNR